jgi:hypothetical protein
MFGVYWFAGGFLGGLALLALVTMLLALPGVNVSHRYALGRLLLAFTIFWAYVAYFQYFLIWAADKPEEVPWYFVRTTGSWGDVAVALAVGRFAVPFLLLLPWSTKRHPLVLLIAGGWQIAAHWLDVHWLVLPALHEGGFAPHWLDLGATLLVGGLTAAGIAWQLRRRALAPANDPSLAASLAYRSG